MWQIYLNYHQRMGILPLKKRVNAVSPQNSVCLGSSLSMSPARRLAHFMPPWSQIVTCVSLAASKCVHPMSQYLPHDPCMASTLLKCPAIASVTERIPCIFGGYYSPTNWCPNICNATQGGRSQGTDLIDNLQKTVLSDQRRHLMFRCFATKCKD